MPLNATTLRNLIDTTFAGLSSSYADAPSRDTIKTGLIQAVATAIVEHLDEELEVGGGGYTAVAALPAVSSVAGGDLMRVSQSGTERKATLTEVVALAGGGYTAVADLPAVSSVAAGDLFRVSQSGTERKATLNDVVGLVPGGFEPVADTDIGGAGTSTTSNVANGGVDTNIVLPLGVGTYQIFVQASTISASAGGPRTQWVAADDLVHNFLITQSVLSFGATSSQISFSLNQDWTQHSGGSTVALPLMITSTIRVTTAGNLKLRLATVNNGISTTLSSIVAAAYKL